MILNTDTCTVTKINETGGLCWSLLADKQSADSLASLVREEYGLLNEPSGPELEPFLSELLEYGLIQHA